MTDLEQYMTTTEAADTYRLGDRVVRKAAADGRIDSIRVGRDLLVNREQAAALWGYRLHPDFVQGAGRPKLPKRWRRKRDR
jgi:excisionase family DNA binding protein